MGNHASKSTPSTASSGSERTRENRPRCYYELLGVSQNATSDELKKAYRQKALQLHPDKNPHRKEEAHHEFAAVRAAYDVLYDPQERAWYDRHRTAILSTSRGKRHPADQDDIPPSLDDLLKYFNESIYDGFNDNSRGFYTVYRELFQFLEDFENEEEIQQHQMFSNQKGATFSSQSHSATTVLTSFGSKNTPYEPSLRQFYDKWLHFSSTRSFDEADPYPTPSPRDANRRHRRVVNRENQRERERLRREYSETVRDLAAFVRKRDPRYQIYQHARQEKREQAELERKYRERQLRQSEREHYVEQDWTRVDPRHHGDNDVEEKKSDAIDEESFYNDDQVQEYYCAPCKKLFKTAPQWYNHEKSKKHRATLFSMGIDPDGIDIEDENEDEDEDGDNVNDRDQDDQASYKLVDSLDGEDDNSDMYVYDQAESKSRERAKDSSCKTQKSNPKLNVNHVQKIRTTAIPIDKTFASLQLQDDTIEPDTKPKPTDSIKPITIIQSSTKTRKPRRATKSKTKKEDNGIEENSHVCTVCGVGFESRNQLFKHIRELDHAQAPTNSSRNFKSK